ncbi:UNVERIFIED_CONTAM: Transposon Tf2-12 polyprotein [Sesamum angustifolium]|uniref:Transposon Tf2-12 polyprotein n=1 Tax=Sesamum angustifolium TaxID=2727405 RepID=A0AAW2N8G2_9LAMI
MQLARQGKISLEENSATTNAITIESGHVDDNKDSCNAMHGDNITSNEDTLFEKEDSSDADDLHKVNRIMIDGGSAVNLLPLRILKELEIPIDELSNNRLMIQAFNQGGQRVVGIIRMQLAMEDMVSSVLFHVIDTKTSYNILLGRPWLHENVVVPSTWHQYFKYYHNGIMKKINMKQPSKPPHKGFVPSTQEEEGEHEAPTIDEKRFDPKAFKFLIKEKGHVIQDSRVGLDFTPPKPVCIAIKRVNSNYVSEGFSSTEDHKREENLRESVFNGRGPHRKELHRIANRQFVFDSAASSNYISNGAKEDIAQTFHITLVEDGEVEEEDAEDAPAELEEGIKATIDELKEVNLGDIENPRPIYISASLTHEEEGTYIALLHEFEDVFAWSYKEMPRLDPKIAVHHFIVPVKKKNGQIQVCVDFGDLNNACPKDDFLLPIAKLMIDATTDHEALSFMDGSSRYNQIRIASADEELTAFRTPKGIYCYKVIPLGLKNAGATYQKAMQKIFDDMLHKNVECYVEDLVVKSKKRKNHFHDLRKVFERLRRYQLKMNLSKCAFGVTSGKFLGFIVCQQGIEIEQAKIDAFLRMPESGNIHKLKSL